jgi:ribosomal protein S18 acetylase RimI-like enzyme
MISTIDAKELQIRQATQSDESWLYQLYCTTMRAYIEKTWGWDEQFQKNSFKSNLAPEKFNVIVIDGKDTGAYLVNEEDDHLWIEMLLIQPDVQRQGIGTKILQMLKVESQRLQKPIKLSAIKANPAIQFYRRLGFVVYEEDDAFFKMQWASA